MARKTQKAHENFIESQGIPIADPDEEQDIFAPIADILRGRPKPRPMSRGRVQLEKAPNAAVFIESDQYLAGPALHYPQFEIVRDFFELLCPICNDIERVRVRNDVPREEQILFEYDVCPQCNINKNAIRDEFNYYNEMIGVVGMRGGKSVLVACMAAYILHEILCIDDLQEKLGLVRSQEIDGAFVAVSMEQAAETIYGHFRGFYDEAPWFQHYRKALEGIEIADPSLHRGDLYWETDRYIHFKEKRIRIKSLTSNSGSIAGKTRIFAVIDELSRMDLGESKRSANEVYRVLKRSLLTIKASVDTMRQGGDYSLPDARMFCISSPMFEDDKSMQLLKQASASKKMFAFHRATWEFNPDISKELLAEEFAHDPVGAERDYGANPPGAINPFIKNPDIVEVCVDDKRSSSLSFREENLDENVKGICFHYVKMVLLDVRYRNLNEYAIHADPGHAADSFSFAIGHLENGVTVIDAAVEARPIPKNNKQGLTPREVHFPSMTKMMTELASKLSIRMMSYDRWNSAEQIHLLRQAGVLSFQRDINRDDYLNFLNAMISNKIKLPKRENEYADPLVYRMMPCAKALLELKRLNDDGVRVDHPKGGSSDVIQCYVGVHRILAHPERVISSQELNKVNKAQGLKHSLNRNIGKVIRLPPRGTRR